MNSTKHEKFKRLAKLRGERILKNLRLLANLSNKHNYEYTDEDVRLIFAAIEEELKITRNSYLRKKKRGINL